MSIVSSRFSKHLFLALVAMASACAAAAQDWSLRFDGAGPLRVGMSLREVSAVLGETLARVDMLDSSLRTSTGLAIGDPVARVKEIYGSALDIQPHFYVAGEQNLTAFADDKQYAVRFEKKVACKRNA